MLDEQPPFANQEDFVKMIGMISNPGAGPIGGVTSYADACSNIEAFVSELGLSDPPVRIRKPRPARVDEGRFLFTLCRGIRKALVDMPGIPLAEVRYIDGANAWRFPRMYVDGSSWLWEFAVDMARLALRDPDGSVERRVEASRLRCEKERSRSPRCPVCQTVLRVEQTRTADNDGDYRILCLSCTPCIEEFRQTLDNTVYRDDKWKTETHYFVRRQRVAPEVPGHDRWSHPDALCGAEIFRSHCGHSFCIRKHGHDGRCEPSWRLLERTLVFAGSTKGMPDEETIVTDQWSAGGLTVIDGDKQ